MSSSSRSIQIPAQGVELHALERNPAGSPVVLFLHGWLDHCHSFDWVCDALPSPWRMLALDFRGHGASGHQANGRYDLPDLVADVDATLLACKLESVHLVGHSMGAVGAVAFAAAQPERVQSLSLIENFGPVGGPPDVAPERMRQFLRDLNKPRRKKLYASIEDAVAQVRANNSSFTPEIALHMTRHGLHPVDGGYQFTFDPALRRRSGLGMDEDQVLALLGALKARTQIVRGSHGFKFDESQMQRRFSRAGTPTVHLLEGGHHVHLERPKEVAALIERFVSAAS